MNGQAWTWARSLLRLTCPHARRDVFVDGLRSENRMPFHRLFLVPPESPSSGGRVVDLAGGTAQPLRPGTVTLLPIGRTYRFEFAPGLRLVGFHFRLEAVPGRDLLGDGVVFSQQEDPAVTTEAWGALGQESADAWLRSEGILRSILGRMVRLSWAGIDAGLAVERRWGEVLRRLEAEGAQVPSIAALARQAGVSRACFSRRFRAELGATPRTWRDRRRAERAVERLLAGQAAVQDLAAEMGFSDAFAFSKFVRRTTGLSPTALRAQGPWSGR